MIRTQRTKVTLTIMAIFIGMGCSSQKLDTGAIDYSVYPLSKNEENTKEACDPENHEAVKFFPLSKLDDLELIRPGDSISVRLAQGFIYDFNEMEDIRTVWTRSSRKFDANQSQGNGKSYTQGEIAIVADIVELDSDIHITHQSGLKSADRGRLVYYNEDVRESGQYLNFSNIPLYGPVTYSGGDLFLRLFVLELDEAEAAQLSSTLSLLADVGGKAYPPSSEILSLLTSVGSAFLAGNSDDLEFEYELTLQQGDGISMLYAPLAVGTYVFLKLDDRDDDFPWCEVRLNRRTGRLNPRSKNTDFRGATYFTVSISKNETAIVNDSGQIFSNFRNQIQKEINADDSSPVLSSVKDVSFGIERLRRFDRARGSLKALNQYSISRIGPAKIAQALDKIISAICPDEASGSELNLSTDQLEYLGSGLFEALQDPEIVEILSAMVDDLDESDDHLVSPSSFTVSSLECACSKGKSSLIQSFFGGSLICEENTGGGGQVSGDDSNGDV